MGGRVRTEQGASGGIYAYTYDGAGRVIGRDRNGEETRYEYNGRGQVARELSGSGERRWLYDGAGRVRREETITANTTESGQGAYYRTWEYDDGNRRITETSGGKYRTEWYYNGWEEVVRKVDGEDRQTGGVRIPKQPGNNDNPVQ